MTLNGPVAIVTGTSAGIGAASAKRLARRGRARSSQATFCAVMSKAF
jgi:NAD(P)-dependent dehydrogenase (short-subunit alcohol dehydrogenase family)